MRVISRFNKDHKQERCPKCSEVFVNFMEIDENMLACYKCGTVFIKKEVRDRERGRIIEQLMLQEKEKEIAEKSLTPKEAGGEKLPSLDKIEAVKAFECEVCGKPCKSIAGLGAHMRIHENNKEIRIEE